MKRSVSVGLAIILGASALESVEVPGGFTAHEVGSSGEWDKITGLAIAPDGRVFVIEKRGRVHIVEKNVKLQEPFLDIEREVLNHGDRGLLGIALDPDFLENGHVYLLYTVDPDADGIDSHGGSAFGRLTRFTASSRNPNVADTASRRVLIGPTWSTGIPAISSTHAIGCLRFAADGSLLVSAGDGARADLPDPGGKDPSAFRTGRTPIAEDIGAFRAQWIGSLAGKILRVDPSTGNGLPSNPYYTGNPSDNASRVWAYGLRNPFRFTVRPGTGSANPSAGSPGTLYISDVGWRDWEEVDVSASGGENFGWPCREGPFEAAGYPASVPAHHGCDSIGTPANPRGPTEPLVTWHHDDSSLSRPPPLVGKCVTGIAFYTGQSYPSRYQGLCFVAEYDKHWIRGLRVDSSNRLVEVVDFATDAGGPVDLVADPVSGDLFYVSILRNEVRRIRYDPSNSAPIATAAGTPTAGNAPLTVRFSSAGSRDPDGDAITYAWSFGDGAVSTEANPVHTYDRAGAYPAILTADDGRGGQGSATVNVTVSGEQGGNQPPTPTIVVPAADSFFMVDSLIELRGTATDEDPVNSLSFEWEIILHHNTHVHPGWLELEGQVASFVIREHDDGTGTWLEVVLRVTDTGGLTATRSISIFPPDDPLLIDNGDPGTSSTGLWLVSDAPFPYGPDSIYSKVTNATYSYDFVIPRSGDYRVLGWWTVLSTRNPSTVITIHHARGSKSAIVNQTDVNTADIWNDLGTYRFEGTGRVTVTSAGPAYSTAADAFCLLPDASGGEPRFRRGDADNNGAVNITDAITILGSLFRGTGPLGCNETGDADNDGVMNITDAIVLLDYLFRGGPRPAPPAPGGPCGTDLDPPGSPGDLGCAVYESC
jgi:glucose/arabinose dehydrogenase